MKSSLLLFLVMILLLAACSPASPPASPPSNEPFDGGELREYVVSMEVSGGIAGISEKYTIFPDGKIISNQGKEISVDAQKLSGLHTALQDQDYFHLQDDYTIFSNCRDCFTFTITVQNGNQIKSVRADEGTSNSPEGLWIIVREINGLVAGVK